jgi:pimeloyl-ACP methyl ester carboxylesterase
MTKVRAGALDVNYQRLAPENPVADPAPIVVLVHGLLTDSLASYYFTIGPALSKAGYDVLMYDLRGHGRTTRTDSGYRVEDIVEDFDQLLTALEIDRPVHVAGNSFGGTLACAMAVWRPERIASVIMIESEPPTPGWVEHICEGLFQAKQRLDLAGAQKWLAERVGKHTAKLSMNANRILQSTSLVYDIPQSRTIANYNEIQRPLLSIFGSESDLQRQQPLLERDVMDSRTVVIEGHGHSVLVEADAKVRDTMLDWLADYHGLPSRTLVDSAAGSA